ncbi:MAG: hypothetical protein QOD41_3260 [Cryptosporangiaceae bacterium]|nr:hypothetical protein [Cryptosporangiaceae bacterium]
MINFRYHVVSITAVFLALAIGLVLGTAALNGPAADHLKNQVSSLNNRNSQLRERSGQLQNQVNSQADFVQEAAPMLLAGRLTGRTVLVVSTDTTDRAYRDAVVEMLRKAGATLTGKLQLREPFTNPARDAALQDLGTRLVPAGVTSMPNNGIGVETASALLAVTLVSGVSETVTDSSRTSILAGFTSLGVASEDGEHITKPAEAVVVVAGPAATDQDADQRNHALLTILQQFDRVAKYMVLAAPQATGSGNPVASIRRDDSLAKHISTVDNVSSPEGQVVTSLALAEQFRGKTGHYGSGDGSTARVPNLQAQ